MALKFHCVKKLEPVTKICQKTPGFEKFYFEVCAYLQRSQHIVMPNTDKRKYPRVETRNVVSYVCMDKKGNEIGEGMGETLNISQGGILLKSVAPIESEFVLLMSIDFENNIMEIRGKVAHSIKDKSGKFETGISFLGTHEETIQIIKKFVKTYHSRKNKSHS